MKFLIILTLLLSSIYANNANKGQTYYLYLLKDKLGYNGAVFAKKHNTKEWNELFNNDAKTLKTMLIKENDELETLTNSKKFEKITPFIKAFVMHYAKDVKNSPSCN